MNLISMELYKILHKKMSLCIGVAIILIMLLYFFSNVFSEESVVNGVYYTGFSAIAKDREITAPYAGVLNDDVVKNIIDTYGFPHKVEANYGHFRDQNFLNGFVTGYLSDGYMNGWEEGQYRIPEHIVPIPDSEIGKYAKEAGKEISFGYYKGFSYLLDYWQMGMVLAQIWILLTIAPLFAEEFQLKTNTIIFTTCHGRKKDIWAKVCVGLLVTLMAFLWVVLSGFLMCKMIFGFEGADVFREVVIGYVNANPVGTGDITILGFTKLIFGIQFLSMVLTAAISIFVSSQVKTSFHAVIYTGLIYVIPLLFHIASRSNLSYLIFFTMPMGRAMYTGVLESWNGIGFMQTIISIVLILGCLTKCFLYYRKADAN